MNLETFRQAFGELQKEDPFLFEDHDPLATDAELAAAEARLGCRLGNKYAQFLREYGGGGVGACTLYSVHHGSDWQIVEPNVADGWLSRGLLAFAPNGTGDYYVFRVTHGIADDEVLFYDHETRSLTGPEYPDVFEYVLATCG